jgi:hypothetical protein
MLDAARAKWGLADDRATAEGDGWVIWSDLATLAATLGQALLKSLNRIGRGAR